MVVFVSSTFVDLRGERTAAQEALREGEAAPWGMEYFSSEPTKPLEVCLRNVGQCAAVVLVIGFRGGSVIPENPGLTYTAAEIEEAVKLQLPVFAFIKTEAGAWRNDEPAGPVREALDNVKRRALEVCPTPAYFETVDQLKFKALTSLNKWNDLGRPGAHKTFASRSEFFAPFEQPSSQPRLFDFSQRLQGRTKELEALDRFLTDDNLVAVLPGRGGLGKTKVLHEWTADPKAFGFVFLRDGAAWHAESDKELPQRDVVIIADDAHRATHLSELFGLIRTLSLNPKRRVKLLLSTRPSGIAALRFELSHFEPSRIDVLEPLEKLRVDEVRALASELLGSDYQHLLPWLVRLSADTPLVTVVGGRLIARGKLANAAIANEDEFRRAVFDKFTDELTDALPKDGFPWRKVINLLAAVGPVWARSEHFVSLSEAFLGVRGHELLQAIDLLESNGLLVRSEGRLRIAPDTLTDYLLEDACVNPRGESTGYAEAVFQAFRTHELPNLLSNFAELEWHLQQKVGTQTEILPSIWEALEREFQDADAVARSETLKALRDAAIFQPAQTLRIVRLAMEPKPKAGLGLGYRPPTQEDVLAELPALLESIADSDEYTEEAAERLFTLCMVLPRSNGFSRGPSKVLVHLASYQLYKPVEFLAKIASVAITLAAKPDAFAGEFTPLDIADQLLEKEAQHETSTETTFSIGSLALNYPAWACVRDTALEVIRRCLNSTEPRRSSRAVKSLSAVVSCFVPIVGRELTEEEEAWQDAERLLALDILEARIRRPDTPIPLLRQIRNMLRQHVPIHHSEAFNQRLRAVQAAIPESQELLVFDAFCTPFHERRGDVDDLIERERLHGSELRRAADEFGAAHPSADDLISALDHMAQQADEYGISTAEPAYSFIALLCRNLDFMQRFIEYVLDDPHPQLGFQIRVVLLALRETHPSAYEELGLRCAAQPKGVVAWGAAHAVCLSPGLQHPIAADVNIIAALAQHSNPDVRRLAIEAAGKLGHKTDFTEQAATILAGVELEGQPVLANTLCEAFGTTGTPVALLSREQIRSILDKLVIIGRLDDRKREIFLQPVAHHAPDLLFDFFLRRLKQHSNLKAGSKTGYSPWGNATPAKFFSGVATPLGFEGQLRQVRDLMLTNAVPMRWCGELYWALGEADGAARSAIAEWLEAGDEEWRGIAEYLTQGPERFARNHRVSTGAVWIEPH